MVIGPKKSVSISMSLEMHRQIKEQARATDRTMAGYIRQVLKRYLWHVEHAPEELTDKWRIQ